MKRTNANLTNISHNIDSKKFLPITVEAWTRITQKTRPLCVLSGGLPFLFYFHFCTFLLVVEKEKSSSL